MFSKKNILIIGGSSGIGLQLAKSFAMDNAQIIIASRDLKKLKTAKTKLDRLNLLEIDIYQVDVSSFASVCDLLKQIKKKYKKIDVVICSAGAYIKKTALKTDIDDWNYVMSTNLNGTYYVNKVFGQEMVKRKKGCLINISSLGAKVALSETLAYNVSKSGVEMLTKSLACEWADKNVRVNTILPGVFKTSLNEKVLSRGKRAKNIINNTPMKRFGRLEELVTAAKFLADDKSSFVTGTSIVVDGGFLAYAGY